MGIPIPKTLVVWASPVTPALTLTQIAKVILEAGDAHIASEGFGNEDAHITVTPVIILIRWIVIIRWIAHIQRLNAALKELFRGKHDVAPYKGIQDSLVFWISGTGFQFLSVGLDSGFQSLVGFRIPKPRIIRDFPDSGIQIPLHVANG